MHWNDRKPSESLDRFLTLCTIFVNSAGLVRMRIFLPFLDICSSISNSSSRVRRIFCLAKGLCGKKKKNHIYLEADQTPERRRRSCVRGAWWEQALRAHQGAEAQRICRLMDGVNMSSQTKHILHSPRSKYAGGRALHFSPVVRCAAR